MSYNKDTDFYSGVSRVVAAKPDVMFIGGASEPTALVVKTARELGFTGRLRDHGPGEDRRDGA